MQLLKRVLKIHYLKNIKDFMMIDKKKDDIKQFVEATGIDLV